ncbi:Hypothetical protein HVR_LOCUS1272 [uncultured virus]|nr:Hypothetical protein HVR_LOCUS1272 [uncultured virus]
MQKPEVIVSVLVIYMETLIEVVVEIKYISEIYIQVEFMVDIQVKFMVEIMID